MHFCSCTRLSCVRVYIYTTFSLSLSACVCVCECCINKYTQNSPAQNWALLFILIFITVTSISTSRSCHKKQTQQQKVARKEGEERVKGGSSSASAVHCQISCNFRRNIYCAAFLPDCYESFSLNKSICSIMKNNNKVADSQPSDARQRV